MSRSRSGFLKSHQNLVIDTQFSPGFKDTLLASPEIPRRSFFADEALDGLLVHAENLQALRLLGAAYRRQAKCIYIDPPYNTAKDVFPTRTVTSMEHGWRCIRQARGRARTDREDDVMFISIDQNEFDHLSLLGKHVFARRMKLARWSGRTRDNNPTRVATEHEYVLCYARDQSAVGAEWKNNFAEAKELLLAEHDRLKAFRLKPPQIEEQIARSLGTMPKCWEKWSDTSSLTKTAFTPVPRASTTLIPEATTTRFSIRKPSAHAEARKRLSFPVGNDEA